MDAAASGGRRPQIEKLAAEVADAIAAGEVVERPASVVKELVENGLDAAATRITVEIEGGGTELVRVVDDGVGIPAGELALAFERHATSKLRGLGDLQRVRSFGFRGEALASIAAVAQVVVTSRPAAEPAGFQLEASPSGEGKLLTVGAPPGTSVEVRRLFHNTPARREFLRSARVEAAACLRAVAEAALGRPDVRFEARVGGRRVLSTRGDGDLAEAARAALGRTAAGGLIPVSWTGARIAVVGLLGAPGEAQPTRRALVLMVNGRRVHQRVLLAAVEGAFRGLLETGRHPVAVLDIRCDPEVVDVNVHPAKREVRFRDEGEFFEAVHRACWEALRTAAPASLALPAGPALGPGPVAGNWARVPTGEDRSFSEELSPDRLGGALAGAAGWKFLGQAHRRYLVVETDGGLALLDQHAAHEKVLYARIVASLELDGSDQRPAQGLLEPLLIEVGPEGVARLGEAAELLQRAGFELESFGEATLRCAAVPVGTRLSELKALLLEVLGVSGGEVDPGTRRHRVAASVACHSAVRFGDPVGPEQAEELLRGLALTPGGITCPHGRPALLLLSQAELLAAFRRHG